MTQIESTLKVRSVAEAIFGAHAKHYFPIDPIPAPRMTQSDKWKKRKCVIEYFGYKRAIYVESLINGYKLGPILNICFVIPMPPSWSKKKRAEMLAMPHQQKPDRDNLLKAFQDAFSQDDSHVWDGRTIKLWGEVGAIYVF